MGRTASPQSESARIPGDLVEAAAASVILGEPIQALPATTKEVA